MSASRGRDGLLFLLTLAGGAGLAVSCNGPTTGGGDDGAVSLRQALTAAADEDAPELFHRDRVRLYEELAVHGAVQSRQFAAFCVPSLAYLRMACFWRPCFWK